MSQSNPKRTVMVQGRIVWVAGDLFKGGVKIDQQTNRPQLNDKGEQVQQWSFGLAVPKSILHDQTKMGKGQEGEIWAAIHEEAWKIYTNRQTPPDFAWKYKDGDGIDHNGVNFAQRAGYQGHMVFSLSTQLPIKFYKFDAATNKNFQIEEGIKCGDYVNVQVTVEAHPPKGRGKAGLYLNPMAVQFLGYGEAIVNTPSGDAIFGTAAPVVPQGASLTPIAQPGFIVPPNQGVPNLNQAYGQPQNFGQPASAPQGFPMPAQQAAPVTPHHAVLPPQFQQQAPAPQGFPMGNAQPVQPAATQNGSMYPQGGANAAFPSSAQPPVPMQGNMQQGFQPVGVPYPNQQPAQFPVNPPMPGGFPVPGQGY